MVINLIYLLLIKLMMFLIMVMVDTLDTIYKHLLLLNKNSNPLISKLLEIIESEEYDTESVDIDLDIFVECGVSNISLSLNDDKHLIINQMVEKFNHSKSYVYLIIFQTQIRSKTYNETKHTFLFVWFGFLKNTFSR